MTVRRHLATLAALMTAAAVSMPACHGPGPVIATRPAETSVATAAATTAEPATAHGRGPTVANGAATTAAADASPAQPAPARAQTPQDQRADDFAHRLDRWADVQTLALAMRYRVIENSAGAVTSNHLQFQETFRFRLKADPAGRVTLNAGFGTGSNFVGGWNNAGIGPGGDGTYGLLLKLLFVDVRPVQPMDVQAGSLPLARGQATEVTTYDNDGYMTGERVIVRAPKQVFFDEVTYTQGYLGDADTADVFHRTTHLDTVNYYQILVDKTFSPRLAASTEYSTVDHQRFVRAAVRVRARELRVVDDLRVEGYRRFGTFDAGGFAVSGEKPVAPRVTLGLGLANVDSHYDLNGDNYQRGLRLFTFNTIRLSPELALVVQLTRAFDNDYPIPNRTRLNLGLNYELAKALQRAHVLAR